MKISTTGWNALKLMIGFAEHCCYCGIKRDNKNSKRYHLKKSVDSEKGKTMFCML